MNLEQIRRVIVTALFSDEVLMEQLVLKGGNALSLVHGISQRTSLDLDFSMSTDFADVDDARRRLFSALHDRFDAAGYVVFDEVLEPKPKLDGIDEKPWWGGYELRFKLIQRERFNQLAPRIEKLRFNAIVTGRGQDRTFTVDLSKYEYTGGKTECEFDEYKIYVYSPEMIAAEKLRAICQQFPDYLHKARRKARARDFYDIHAVLTARGIDIASADNQELVRRTFDAKRVPLAFLGRIHQQREFHRLDWQAVVASTRGMLEEFDFYFDFVLDQARKLQPLWVE